jgi:hypothetical protein
MAPGHVHCIRSQLERGVLGRARRQANKPHVKPVFLTPVDRFHLLLFAFRRTNLRLRRRGVLLERALVLLVNKICLS